MPHTPGPWTVSAEPFPTTVESLTGCQIAIVEDAGIPAETQAANAHLLAAAPDLLAAAKLAFPYLDDIATGPYATDARDALRSAIARAQGDTTS